MANKDIEEITELISELTLMKKEIKHNKVLDPFKILKRHETYLNRNSDVDSGFDSEPQQSKFQQLEQDNFILPAYNLKQILFNSSDFDELIKHLFKFLWKCLQQSLNNGERNQLDTIIECIKDLVVFLTDSNNDIFREQVVGKNLEAMFNHGVASQNEDLYDYVMEIFIKLGAMKELFPCIFYLIIDKIKVFCTKVNAEKPDGSFLFKFEKDFSRINTLLLTAQLVKTDYGEEFHIEVERDVCYILETFSKYSDFYMLCFMAQQVFLP